MATFSNQTTNLSTLSTSLAALCGQFEALMDVPAENSRAYETDSANLHRYDQAEDFLDSLVKRVDDVDDALMKSTEFLLPTLSGRGETSRMTATELSQVVSSLYGIHSLKIDRFARLIGDNSPTESNHATNAEADEGVKSDATPYHWSLGMPLEKVVETDNETDRYSYSTAASMKSRSFSYTPGGQGPSTPLTPSMDGLRLSASTASILTREQPIFDLHEAAENHLDVASEMRLIGDTRGQEAEKNRTGGDVEFGCFSFDAEEDEQDLSGEIARTFLNKTTSPEDESADGSMIRPKGGPDSSNQSTQGGTRGNRTALNYDSEDDDDEVTTLCPTVLANQSLGETVYIKRFHQVELSPQTDFGNRPSIFRSHHDISHVVVQTEASPSQTMLTMDGTIFSQDADARSQSSGLVNDAASLGDETPVLDRYRIILDDNSIGFKILPNERGSHKKHQQKATATLMPITNAADKADFAIPKSLKFCKKSTSNENLSSFRKMHYPARSEAMLRDYPDDLEKENQLDTIFSDEPSKKSVAFKSPINATKEGTRSSPFAKSAINGENVRFDTSELSTGSILSDGSISHTLNDTKQQYRKTPHRSVAGKLSIESLKFASASPSVHFKDRQRDFATKTPPLKRGGGFRRTPYRGAMAPSPTRESHYAEPRTEETRGATKSPLGFNSASRQPKIQILNTGLGSPFSHASTISALTGITTYTENQQRVLFPEKEAEGTTMSLIPARKSIAKISEQEFEIGGSIQFSLEETNRAITALNGAAFLRRTSWDSNFVFSDVEAYKILKNAGFRRRNAKGILMCLCHWQRLELVTQEASEDVFDTPSYSFRIVFH